MIIIQSGKVIPEDSCWCGIYNGPSVGVMLASKDDARDHNADPDSDDSYGLSLAMGNRSANVTRASLQSDVSLVCQPGNTTRIIHGKNTWGAMAANMCPYPFSLSSSLSSVDLSCARPSSWSPFSLHDIVTSYVHDSSMRGHTLRAFVHVRTRRVVE